MAFSCSYLNISIHKLRNRWFLETQNTAAVSVVKCTENQLKNPSVFIISELHIGMALFWVKVICKLTGSLVVVLLLTWLDRMVLISGIVSEGVVYITEEESNLVLGMNRRMQSLVQFSALYNAWSTVMWLCCSECL